MIKSFIYKYTDIVWLIYLFIDNLIFNSNTEAMLFTVADTLDKAKQWIMEQHALTSAQPEASSS